MCGDGSQLLPVDHREHLAKIWSLEIPVEESGPYILIS